MPSAPPVALRGDLPALTGLRIVAAGWVVVFHFGTWLAPLLDQVPFLPPVVGAGWIGVELFFVLSGFVLTHNYLDECGRRWSTATAARFLVKRFARVWPAWAALTVVAAGWLAAATLAGLSTNSVFPHPGLTVGNLLRQLTMTQMWGRDTLWASSYDSPGWSISAEWLAYLCFPLLALLLRPLRRLHPALNLVLAAVAMLPLAVPAFLHGPTDVEVNWVLRIACSFTAGSFASLAVRDLRRTRRVDQWGLFLCWAAIVGVLVTCFWAHWRTVGILQAGGPLKTYSGVAVAWWPLLVAGLAMTARGPARWLSAGPMVYGGRLSYCLYLTHWTVMDIGLTLVWQHPAQVGVMTPGTTLAVPALILLSCAAAAGLHHGVEEPARKLLLRLLPAPGRNRRPAAPAPAPVTDVLLPAAVGQPTAPFRPLLDSRGRTREPAGEVAARPPRPLPPVPGRLPAPRRPAHAGDRLPESVGRHS